MGRFRDRIRNRRNRSGWGWRIALINTLFWVATLGASGFDPQFKWFAALFIAIPWIFIGGINRKIDGENNYFERQEPLTTPTALPQPLPMHEKILDEAKDNIDDIKSAANVASGELGANLHSMVNSLEIVQMALIKSPEKLSAAQRLFTYYVPETANLIKARGKAAAANDAARVTEIDSMIGKLKIAFEQFKGKMSGDDARNTEIDMKLLTQSLQEDFGHIEIKDKIQ